MSAATHGIDVPPCRSYADARLPQCRFARPDSLDRVLQLVSDHGDQAIQSLAQHGHPFTVCEHDIGLQQPRRTRRRNDQRACEDVVRIRSRLQIDNDVGRLQSANLTKHSRRACGALVNRRSDHGIGRSDVRVDLRKKGKSEERSPLRHSDR